MSQQTLQMIAVVETPYYDCYDFKRTGDLDGQYMYRVEVNKSVEGKEVYRYDENDSRATVPKKDRRKYRVISPYFKYTQSKQDVYREDGSVLLEEGKCYLRYSGHSVFIELEPLEDTSQYRVIIKPNSNGLYVPEMTVSDMKYVSDKLEEIYEGIENKLD